MKFMYSCIILALLPITGTQAFVSDVLDVIHVGTEVIKFIKSSWNALEAHNAHRDAESAIDMPIEREKHRKVLSTLRDIDAQITQTELKYAENIAVAIQSVRTFVIDNTLESYRVKENNDIVNRIAAMFRDMQKFEAYQSQLEESTLLKFAEWVVTPNSYSVSHLLNRLHVRLFGADGSLFNRPTNMFATLLDGYEVNKDS